MVNVSKCHFLQESVVYLGYTVSEKGLLPGEREVHAVKDFPTPKTLKAVQSFHGLCSYFHRFVPHFAKIAQPLMKLFRLDQPWMWEKEQELAFQALKDALTSAEMLAYPDHTKPFFLHTDASMEGLGVCLMQRDAQNPKFFHPVGYASRALLDRETRYTITELEGLVVVYGLQYYKYLIHGCDITMVTDHQALKHLMDCKEPHSNRMFHWRLEIVDFEVLGGKLKFQYLKGAEHKVADALSRSPVDLP